MKTSCCHTKRFYKTGDKVILCGNTACNNYLAVTICYRDYSYWKTPTAVLIFAFMLFFTPDDFSMENGQLRLCIPQFIEMPLTIQNLHAELLAQKILCPEHVLAQVKIESANLTSYLLKRTNNMLGMRYPITRNTTACGIYIPAYDTIIMGKQNELKKYLRLENYAVYKNWKDAIVDYRIWQESNFNLTERYLTFLGKVYAEDTQYVQKIKQITGSSGGKVGSH